MEELRAELASAFVGGDLGIPSEIDNHASYVSSWLDVLRKDKREILRTAADAQRIADYLLAYHPLYAAPIAVEKSVKKSAVATADTDKPETVAISVGSMPEHIRRSMG